jgi:diketogulonate reductase-like aldo/keto reductase
VAQRRTTERVAQAKVVIGDRSLSKQALFNKSAFKKRLTHWMDRQADEWILTRDAIRNELIALINDEATHTFGDTHEAVQAAVDRAISEAHQAINPLLIFGMDGRTLQQIKAAIKIGYRRFDCAESYGNTNLLAQAVKTSGVKLADFRVTYKFDVRSGEGSKDLKSRLTNAAALFGGSVEDIIIHNLDAPHDRIKAAYRVLDELQREDVAEDIGVGNVREEHAHLIEELEEISEIDVIEVSIAAVLTSAKLLDLLETNGAHLYYYDVVSTAREIGFDSEVAMRNLVYTITRKFPDSSMILSSGSVQRQVSNFRAFGDGEKGRELEWDDDDLDAAGAIDKWRKSSAVCQANDEGFVLPGPVADWLSGIAGGGVGAVRLRITQAAALRNTPLSRGFISTWLGQNSGGALTNVTLGEVRVPSRVGLRKRFRGMTLGDVLGALFGAQNCDWKWSIELVNLMIASAGDWNDYLGMVSTEITG